jgi:Glucosidase II beta subunit-like protein
VEILEVELQVNSLESELEGILKPLQEAKLNLLQERRHALMNAVNMLTHSKEHEEGSINGIFQYLEDGEIKLLIQLACQIAGEMEGSIKEKTCVPLRLAGVDMGILWEDEVFKDATANIISIDDDSRRSMLSDIVYRNHHGEKIWSERSLAKSTGGRRLDDHYHHDDDYHNEYDSEYDEGDDDDDDYQIDETHKKENVVKEDPSEETEPELEKGAEVDKVKAIVEGSAFAQKRMRFLTHAESMILKIDEFLKGKDEEAKRLEELEETEKSSEEKEVSVDAIGNNEESSNSDEQLPPLSNESVFDPIAYNMAKSTLKKRSQAIRRGLQYGVSSYILVDSLSKNGRHETMRSDLIGLATALLMHSRANMEHLWEILISVVPDLISTTSYESQTCASPFAEICPPKLTTRESRQFPPHSVILAGQAMCNRIANDMNQASCESASSEIVLQLDNGYFGYYEVKPRSEDDPLQLLFATVESVKDESIRSLESHRSELETSKSSLESNIRSLEDKIGGRDQSDTLKSELHALKNSCFTVTEGKYDYEVCIHGQATQKDKGASYGTSLGNWRGMSIDEESGERVMLWENGQQCWNGPQRSAKVFVRCGAETKLLSADEPNTCAYVLEMESHIACDDNYFLKYLA